MMLLKKSNLMILGISFLVFIALIFIVDQFLTKEFSVKREILVDAPASSIHKYVSDLKQWPKWTPWQSEDPTIKTELGEVTQGAGATQSWSGSAGEGELVITKSNSEYGINYELSFVGDKQKSFCVISYERKNGLTEVTWTMDGESDRTKLLPGFRTLLLDAMVGEMFTNGLKNLKSVVEASVPNT